MNNIIAGPVAELLDALNSVDKKRAPAIFYYHASASPFKRSLRGAIVGSRQPSPDDIRRSR